MEEQEDFSPELGHEDLKVPTSVYVDNEYADFPIKQNYWSQLGLLLALIGGGIIVVGSFATIAVVKIMLPHGNLDNIKALLDPANVEVMQVMDIVITFAMFFVPAFLFALIVYKKPLKYLKFNGNISLKQLGLVVLIACMALLVGSALTDLNKRIPIPKHLRESFQKAEDEYNEQVFALAKMNNFRDYLVAMFIIALLPAVVEETFFRGTLQQLFSNWFGKPWLAILVTSILFSAIHMSYFGFLTRAMLGGVFGLLFYYGKSIWLNILAHFINNGIAVTSLYFSSMKGKLTKVDLNDHFPLWLSIIAITFLIYLIINFKKVSEVFLAEKETLLLQNNIIPLAHESAGFKVHFKNYDTSS